MTQVHLKRTWVSVKNKGFTLGTSSALATYRQHPSGEVDLKVKVKRLVFCR